jgi:hypothetical protein
LTASDNTRGVESIAGDQKLHQLTAAEVGPATTRSVVPSTCKHQYLNRITEIIMIKLVVMDAIEPHRSIGRYHEIKR